MKNMRVARRYAGALMAAAESGNAINDTARDLEFIASTLRGSRELLRLTRSPVVSPAKKSAVFREIFGAKVGKTTMDFLDLLIAKNRESHLTEIIEQFGVLLDEKLGIVSVDVTAAVEFTASQKKDLNNELERYTRKKVRVRIALDKTIRGGIVVRVGDTVLDASVQRQLEILKARFLEGGPLSN